MLKELDLHITNRCTTKCKYCCFSSNRLLLPEMTAQELGTIMYDARKMGCDHVHFTGGEPLLRKDIFDIVSYANQLGFEMRMQTNGMLLTSSTAKKLYDAGLRSVMISLDSDIEAIHDENRGRGTWKAALDAIQNAMKAQLIVRVNSVLTKSNCKRIVETAEFVCSLGVKNYSAFYFSPIGSGKDCLEQWLNPREYHNMWVETEKRIKKSEKLSQMNIVIEKGYATWTEAKDIDISGFTGCGGGCVNTYNNRDYIIIRCDGNVYPCIMAIDDIPLGNVLNTPLKLIHSESPVWDTLSPRYKSKTCKACEHLLLCGEGCHYYPARKKDEHDGRCIFNELVPLCPIMKYNSKNNALGGSSDDVME